MRRRTTLTLFALIVISASYAQTANFTASVTSGCAPLVVNFLDQSTGNPTSWFWDFGNGATATLQNPSTTYFQPGTYTVKLTVKNSAGSNTLTRTAYITVYGKPSVNFKVSDSAGCFPLYGQFTDLSAPSTGTSNTTWFWDFGDGSQSNEQNPLHVYTSTGNYTVNLKVTSDKGCYNVLTKPSYIKISGGVKSGFTNTLPNVCKPPYNISFTNNSNGPGTLTWLWDFGDGTTSTLQNPSHTYTTSGNYTVSLATTSSDGCSDTLRKTGAVDVRAINTDFDVDDSICANANLSFTNTSTPAPVSSVWSFGDGNSANTIDAVNAYASPGTYTVKLQNTYGFCTDSTTKSIIVSPLPVANFTANNTSKCEPDLSVSFQDQSANAISWIWSFGDSTTSTDQNPTHTYTDYGDYDVQLIVTNASGCTDTLIKPAFVKIHRPVIRIPSLPTEGCIPMTVSPRANITTLDAVTSYLWNFGDGNTSTAANPSNNYTVQGAYTVSLVITTSTGCTDTAIITNAVRVGRKPVADFSASPNPVCAFEDVQFVDKTNEADEWFWNFGDGGISDAKNPLHKYSDTGFFDVQLIATNYGCPDTLYIPKYIKVKPPIAKFGFQTNCSDRLRFQFIDSSIGATGYLWDFGDGTTSTEAEPVHVFPSYKTYTVTLTVTNDTCEHSKTIRIPVVNEDPDFAAAPNPVCRPATVQFAASGITRANVANYSWDVGNGTFTNTTVPSTSFLYNNSGYYTITLITTDIYGCKDTVTKKDFVRVNGPVASFSGAGLQGCKGLTTTFTDLSKDDGVSPIVKWTWDFGDSTTATYDSPVNFQHTYDSAGTYTVSLTVTDAGGCSNTFTKTNYITTSEPKALFTTADTLTCPGSNVQFANQSTGDGLQYQWSFGDGNTSTIAVPKNIYTATGQYTVGLTITDKYGCSDSLINNNYITVDSPVASYSVEDSVSSCTPFEVKFTNTSHYYVSSLWNLGGGVSTRNNPVQYYNTPGIYPIQLIVTSAGRCKDTAYGTVHVYDTVGSNITYTPLNGCKPLSVDLNAYSPGPVSYTWDFGDGVLITNDSTQMNHVYNFFGNFVPKVILTDSSGCIIPVSGLDTIYIKGATAKFGIDKNLFCDSGLVSFLDSTTFNDSLYAYNWDFGDGTISHDKSPVHYYSTPGLYTPTLNVQTENACVDTFKIVDGVKVVQSPLISIVGDSVACVNDFLENLGVFNRSDTSAVEWLWQFPNGNESFIQNPVSQQYTVDGNFLVTAIATNSSGCSDTAFKNLLIHPLPQVQMPSTITMQVGFPVTIPATYSPNVTNWYWSPDTNLSCTDCPQPIAGPKFDTKYLVSFIDSNGCSNAAEVQVIVICKNANVFIPNTFSPNGDGANDIFYVRGKGLDRVKSLRIFNRWGEVVFEKQDFPVNDAMYGWDGTYKGRKPVPDVYVYQVQVFCENSEVIQFDGNVALIQ